MVARLTQKQASLENIGVRNSPSKLAVAQWPKINSSHIALEGGQRLVGLETFNTQVHGSLVAAGVAVYRYNIRMGHKAIRILDSQMDKADKRPPAKVAYLATPGAGKAVSEAWRALVEWIRSNGWEDVFWRTLWASWYIHSRKTTCRK